jgi:hypothetical protein
MADWRAVNLAHLIAVIKHSSSNRRELMRTPAYARHSPALQLVDSMNFRVPI